MHVFIQRQWQRKGLWAWAFSPLSAMVWAAAWLKRRGYQLGWLKSRACSVPVIVVGNLSVGGTGKTPLVIYLCHLLIEQGYRPGVISRGYKAKKEGEPHLVETDSSAAQVGDEPLLIAQRTGCPVMVSPQRYASAQRLIDEHGCDVIISDDGFQHLQLKRDVDILLQDSRGHGNGWCLPSGPLREGRNAQAAAHFLVHHDSGVQQKILTAIDDEHTQTMQLQMGTAYKLGTTETCSLAQLKAASQVLPLHAVAGIGDPERFFRALRSIGLVVQPHPFADHYAYVASDFDFADTADVLITEKDAVKCQYLNLKQTVWVLPVTAELSTGFDEALLAQLASIPKAGASA